MRIVFDCRSIHQYMGGVGQSSVHLVRSVSENIRSHHVLVLIGSNPPDALKITGAEIVQVDAAMIDEPFEQFGLPVVLGDIGADIYLNMSFSIPALKTTRHQIAYIHDIIFEDKPEWVEPGLRAYLQRWSRFAANHADQIVTVSDYSRNRIGHVYGIPLERIKRIHNGISTEAYVTPPLDQINQALNKYGLAASDESSAFPYLLYLGSSEPKKGTPELLSAFVELAKRGFDGQLIMAGGKSGPDWDLDAAIAGAESQIRTKAGSSSAPRIRHIGYVDEDEKKALIAGCALFVYPSHYEGFGLPPLEAMALGISCVVNDATSIPEIVGDAAIRVDVRNREAFVNALERGLYDKEYREWARTAGPARARMFTWDRAANELLDLCESLV
jgi:glycosyltransferase involved in cell wall biosynthesis